MFIDLTVFSNNIFILVYYNYSLVCFRLPDLNYIGEEWKNNGAFGTLKFSPPSMDQVDGEELVNKHWTFNHCWLNNGPTSLMADQH